MAVGAAVIVFALMRSFAVQGSDRPMPEYRLVESVTHDAVAQTQPGGRALQKVEKPPDDCPT